MATDQAEIPFNLEAEESLLGACSKFEPIVALCVERLSPQDFFNEVNREVFDAILSLRKKGRPTDPITLAEELKRRGKIPEPRPLVATLVHQASTKAAAEEHARIVLEVAVRRQMIEVGQVIQKAAADADPQESLLLARTMMSEIHSRIESPLEERPERASDLIGREIDTPTHLLGPLITPGGLSVLAGPTKIGKTNFWLHVAFALTEGASLFGVFTPPRPVSVLLVELELSEATLANRLRILSRDLDWKTGLDRLTVRCERALLLDSGRGAERLLRLIRNAEPPPEVVILDSYNAAIAGDPDKSQEARKALHVLREIQAETGVAFGLTCEVRKFQAGQRSRYGLDDLKGSNEIAYDCDAVMILRPEDQKRSRLSLDLPALRHVEEDVPYLTLVRQGLSFEAVTGDREESELRDAIRSYLEHDDSPTTRKAQEHVRSLGLRYRAEVVNRVLADVQEEQ